MLRDRTGCAPCKLCSRHTAFAINKFGMRTEIQLGLDYNARNVLIGNEVCVPIDSVTFEVNPSSSTRLDLNYPLIESNDKIDEDGKGRTESQAHDERSTSNATPFLGGTTGTSVLINVRRRRELCSVCMWVGGGARTAARTSHSLPHFMHPPS